MSISQQIDALNAAVTANKLIGNSADFARDLIRSYSRKGLSPKQTFWVGKLLERAEKPVQEQSESLNANVKRVFELFETARENGLKYPKIRLETEQREDVVLSQAGERSRYAGQVMITDGNAYPHNVFYGHIDHAGTLHARESMTAGVRDLLTALSEEPEKVAAIYGKRTGHCCFCGTALTDGRSVAVGYGPVCAKKFGLEWGEEKVNVDVAVTLAA